MPIANGQRVMTPAKLRRICDAIRNGATLKAAAESNGTAYSTLWDLRQSSSEVSGAITQACADAEMRATRTVADAFSDADKRVATENARWWLERRRRGEYGPSLDLRAIPTDKLLELFLAATGQADEEGAPPRSMQQLAREQAEREADALRALPSATLSDVDAANGDPPSPDVDQAPGGGGGE